MNIKLLSKLLFFGGLISPFTVSAQPLFSDNFGGETLNTGLWSVDQWGTSRGEISVSDGNLNLIRNVNNGGNFGAGRTDRAALRAQGFTLNFHQRPISANVGIVSFDEPIWGAGSTNATGMMWFSIGPATALDVAALNPTDGFVFPLVWRQTEPGELHIGGEGSFVPQTQISGVPSRINFEVDLDSFEITLEGATFTSGDAMGSSTLTGMHTIALQSDYFFMFGIRNANGLNVPDGSHSLTGVFSDVTVIPEPSTYAAIFGVLALVLLYRRRR